MSDKINDVIVLGAEKESKQKYPLGSLWQLTDSFDNDVVMLTQVGFGEVALISLHDGNRWRDPVAVDSTMKITDAEFSEIVDSMDIKRRVFNVEIMTPEA